MKETFNIGHFRRRRKCRAAEGVAIHCSHQLENQDAADSKARRQVFLEAGPHLGEVDVEHHHDEQEQHHHGTDVDEHQGDRQELGLQQHPDARGREERQDQEERGMHGATRRDDTERRHQQDAGEDVEEDGRDVHSCAGKHG